MASFIAVLTLPRQPVVADHVRDSDLDAYGAVDSADDRGRAQIIITIEARNLLQATATARALFAAYTRSVRVDIMTAEEYQRGDVPIPELLSLTEAAERLGVTRQALQSRINHGTLPARKVGHVWAVPEAAISEGNDNDN